MHHIHCWNKKQGSGFWYAEIQQPVIISFRRANKHIIQHFLHSTECAGISDKISAHFIGGHISKRHIVALLPILPAFRVGDGRKQGPTSSWQPISGCILHTRLWNFSLPSKQVWAVQLQIALPEVYCLAHVVANDTPNS